MQCLAFSASFSLRIPSLFTQKVPRLSAQSYYAPMASPSSPVTPATGLIAASKRPLSESVAPHLLPTCSQSQEVLKVVLRSKDAKLPKRGSSGAAGYDLYSSEDAKIVGRNHGVVSTDISLQIPPGTYARIAPRSGLAVKKGINTGAGVVDADYRGIVGVVLFNHTDEDFVVKKGDRIAQLILERITTPEILEVQELDDTNRGEAGFGSTGVAAPKRGKTEGDGTAKGALLPVLQERDHNIDRNL